MSDLVPLWKHESATDMTVIRLDVISAARPYVQGSISIICYIADQYFLMASKIYISWVQSIRVRKTNKMSPRTRVKCQHGQVYLRNKMVRRTSGFVEDMAEAVGRGEEKAEADGGRVPGVWCV